MKRETIIQVIIIIVLAIILGILSYITIKEIDNKNTTSSSTSREMNQKPDGGMPGPGNDSSDSVESTGKIEVTDSKTLTDEYETDTADESVIKVSDGGNLTLDGAKISKTGGDSTNTENSEFYGVNSGILTTKESTTTIKNSNISTNAKGANAVFSTGTDSKVYVYDSTITTAGESSARGLDSTYGGYIEADNVTISTEGGSCATLATDRGEGTVIARNSKLSTKGSGSPLVYSTGDITLESSEGSADGAQICVVEGKNAATISDSKLSCSGKGNRNNVDNCGFMIYQSMSGDAGEGTGILNLKNSQLEIAEGSNYYTSAPLFFVTNTDAVINLENNTFKYGSNILLKAEGTSQWGTSGNNGGNVVFNSKSQQLSGDIEIDDLSTLELNLEDSSTLESAINKDNTAKSIKIKLSKDSKLKLTGDSYITELDDEDSSYSNIDFNGYSLYVNGEKIN